MWHLHQPEKLTRYKLIFKPSHAQSKSRHLFKIMKPAISSASVYHNPSDIGTKRQRVYANILISTLIPTLILLQHKYLLRRTSHIFRLPELSVGAYLRIVGSQKFFRNSSAAVISYGLQTISAKEVRGAQSNTLLTLTYSSRWKWRAVLKDPDLRISHLWVLLFRKSEERDHDISVLWKSDGTAQMKSKPVIFEIHV